MKLPEPLIEGKLIERYKRFLADIELSDGTCVTAHCPNPGSMKGLAEPGNLTLLSNSHNTKRKLPLTWELVRVNSGWVGVNTLNPNRLIYEALLTKQIPELAGYQKIKKEATWSQGCRFDFLLTNGADQCFVEVKNVTLAEKDVALFPDAVTERGTKHLRHLMDVVRHGHQAVMLFLVSRGDCGHFRPAETIDPRYAKTLLEASQNGVEILVYRARIEPPEIYLDSRLDYCIIS